MNAFLPANVHKRDLHQIHMMAWKKGVKSLYYCRSLSIQRADAVSEKAVAGPLVSVEREPELPLAAGGTRTDFEECLACQ